MKEMGRCLDSNERGFRKDLKVIAVYYLGKKDDFQWNLANQEQAESLIVIMFSINYTPRMIVFSYFANGGDDGKVFVVGIIGSTTLAKSDWVASI